MSVPDPGAGPAFAPRWAAPTGPRERIVAAACELFAGAGIRAVGVDAIMAVAGVARNTFYRYFPSKDDVVVAFLERSDLEWRSWFASAVHASGTTARERLSGVFGVLTVWFADPSFRGSPLLNAALEVGDAQPPVARLVQSHVEQVEVFLAGLAAQAGAADPGGLARRLLVLLHGAVLTAQLVPDSSARAPVAQQASQVAHALLVVEGLAPPVR